MHNVNIIEARDMGAWTQLKLVAHAPSLAQWGQMPLPDC